MQGIALLKREILACFGGSFKAARALARVEVDGWAKKLILQLESPQQDIFLESLKVAPMDPYRSHDDIGLTRGLFIKEMSVRPDLVGKTGSAIGEIGGI